MLQIVTLVHNGSDALFTFSCNSTHRCLARCDALRGRGGAGRAGVAAPSLAACKCAACARAIPASLLFLRKNARPRSFVGACSCKNYGMRITRNLRKNGRCGFSPAIYLPRATSRACRAAPQKLDPLRPRTLNCAPQYASSQLATRPLLLNHIYIECASDVRRPMRRTIKIKQ